MASRLGDRLNAARRRLFVGRTAEQELFQAAIQAPELPFCLLYIFGPGGVGKTTLMGKFADICRQHNLPYASVDARNVEPSTEAFVHAIRVAMGLETAEAPLQRLAAQSHRHVILIDTYEMLAPLDVWLRETFLPQLSDNVLVVLAGRNPPAPAWRGDVGWQTVIRSVPLRNLNPEESRAYLAKRDIPASEHQELLDFTHGHPLALSLVADVFAQRPNVHFQPAAAPDIIKTLLEQFAQKVPGPSHRTALEACALVRLTTEALLSAMLGIPDAHELFDWLRGLSFIESGPRGLFPHDLAREALCADLRWRNPDWYAELHHRARGYYARGLQQARGPDQQRILFDYLFLHRENPIMRPFFEWQESGSLLTDSVRDNEWPALREMIRRYEGDEAAAHADFWFARQPESVLVARDTERQPAGMVMLLALERATAAEIESDPATAAAWNYLQRRGPLRPGERASLFRFWMARDTYQAVSAVQSLIGIFAAQHYLTTPGLAFTFSPCADPDFWAPVFEHTDLVRLREADYEVGGHRYGVFGHDWRVTPPLAWLALLAERELMATSQARPAPAPSTPIIVLSAADFSDAVRAVLHQFPHPETLRDNPLLRSRLVVDVVGTTADTATRISALQALVKEAAESLKSSPREAKAYRALYHTYLHPAPTQELAAELLDVPFSTFRRHLKAGVSHVVDMLWQRELQGLRQ
jgi:hypothetical protein